MPLEPQDHGEAIAIFRAEVIGALTKIELSRGDLKAELRRLSKQRLKPPGQDKTKTFSVPTLERWYYAYKQGGLAALKPTPRSDRGRAKSLPPEMRTLLLDIRREYPSASVPLILETLVQDGRLADGVVSVATVRRLYREEGLDRVAMRAHAGHVRLPWEAEAPGALWHADVCHGPALKVGKSSEPLRVHAILDDASRYIVGIRALSAERELDMLDLFCDALRVHGRPKVLYLDNGPTYTGDVLKTACARLGIALVHAKPHDPQARGKMERFFRTLREGCLDFCSGLGSLHDVQVRLLAFLDKHYHVRPHAGLLGRSPLAVWTEGRAQREAGGLTEKDLEHALTERTRRRVRKDNTLSIDGEDYQLDAGFLAGRTVTVARSWANRSTHPVVEHGDKVLPLHPVDKKQNATTKRSKREERRRNPDLDFDPPKTFLDRARGRRRPVANGGER
jgi:putative transposase